MKVIFRRNDMQDISYRRTTMRLGLTMLIMLVLFYATDWIADVVCDIMLFHADIATDAVVRELLDSAAYLLSFMLPVLFLRIMTPASERGVLPMSPRLSRRLWLLLPAGLSVIYTLATANAVLLGWLGLSGSPSELHWYAGMELYEGVLLFLASVLVPAFCEEFLFRGAVFSALLPYGKTTAVLGSALLFGLMHQSADQWLYTTAAGVVLAWLVLESGSIWGSVLLHMFNNLFAIIQSILYEQMGPTAILWICVLELLVIGGGLLCIVYLLTHGSHDRNVWTGRTEQPSRPIKGFFTLPMAVYAVLCVGQMILMIVLTKRFGG